MALGATHIKRILSGVTMFAALLACLFAGGWTLRAFAGIAAALALWEFYQMFWPGCSRLPDKAAGLLTGVFLCFYDAFGFGPSAPLVLLGFLSFYAALRFLFTYGCADEKRSSAADLSDGALLVFGVIYIPTCLQLAFHLSFSEQVLALLAAVGSDTGAYYAGSLLGRRRIWPKISPKKSLEGALGGLCASMILLSAYGCLVNIPGLEALSALHFALLGLILSITAQLGDFFESALKRRCKVKDSSNLVPGHGGFMDRLDSILFVLPVYMLIRTLLLVPCIA
ncbi:MAG: phosphatidate cytidylyltransferase [Deltaproteobacteria bacterium]|jgi:phosphatidate cytidylyltransferase|nr:phosphatidate cytidylyltransferase [Deltaproteobacteria bacterium]